MIEEIKVNAIIASDIVGQEFYNLLHFGNYQHLMFGNPVDIVAVDPEGCSTGLVIRRYVTAAEDQGCFIDNEPVWRLFLTAFNPNA
jgi:hypothetical protein